MNDRIYAMVCTTYRTVTVGWISADAEATDSLIRIDEARLLIRWRGDGIMRVGSEGPRDADTVSHVAPWAEVTSITSIIGVSDGARAKFEALP